MLFTQHINALTASVSNIQTQIDDLEAQLKELRNNKANLEAELQTVLTLEGAAESAISQSQSFINAAESLNRTDLIETFWSAMDAMKAPNTPQLPEAPETDSTPDTVPDTNPIEPDTLPDTTPQNGKQPLSVGSAAFDPNQATLDDIKRYVRSHQGDSKTKQYGSLTMRKTWLLAATAILNNG